MSPQLIVIETKEDIEALQERIKNEEYIAFDIETTGLTQQDSIIGYSICFNSASAYYVVLANWTNNCLLWNTDVKLVSEQLISSLQGKALIMHNGVFDCMMVEAFFKIRLIESLHTDTMVLAHLLDENRRIGLKELGAAYYGIDAKNEAAEMKASVAANGGSLTKANYEMYKADSQLMGKYGAKDALLTYNLFYEMVPVLLDAGLETFFYEDECMPLLRTVTYDLNVTGLQVDSVGLFTLQRTLEAECLSAKSFIYQEIDSFIKTQYPGTTKKNGFNIGSSSQLAWLLFGELKLEFNTLTKEGKVVCRYLLNKLPYSPIDKRNFIAECLRSIGREYTPGAIVNGKNMRAKKIKAPWAYIMCDKKTLTKFASKYKWVFRLLEYQKKTKILTTYVEGIQERARYGIIHPSFLQTGTSSGRYSSRAPNFQNLPRDDKRIKACIQARPGKVYVGADYSQLEPRVFAYVSGDKNLLEAFKGDNDFYSVIGMRVYGKTDCTPQKEGSDDAFGVKYKKLRDLSKVIALATVYGATAHQLAPTTGKSIDQTQEDINAYLEEFPGVANMMKESHEQAKKQGYVTNLFGRPRRMPEALRIVKLYGNKPHAELPYEARSLLNLACNHRIQSTAASIVNRAAIAYHKNAAKNGVSSRIVCQVHDSLIVECTENDAENVRRMLQDAMENTTILDGITLEAIPKIGKTLADV